MRVALGELGSQVPGVSTRNNLHLHRELAARLVPAVPPWRRVQRLPPLKAPLKTLLQHVCARGPMGSHINDSSSSWISAATVLSPLALDRSTAALRS